MVATDMNSMQSGPPARKSRSGGASPKIKNKKSSFTFIEIPDVPFPLKYHIVLMFSMACRLVKFLLRGSPTWIWKLLQMMTYIIVLFPAFIRFAWFYISCDRVSLCYKTTKHTSRHYLDVYGSKVDTKSGKAVLVYLTGGAWIIGYKMWGAFLAKALSPFGFLIIIPDYRNFPQATAKEMMQDVDLAIQWTRDNCEEYGGDPNRIVIIGQSAGAHLGLTLLLKRVQEEMKGTLEEYQWKANDLKGFISTSAPYNLVSLKDHFHSMGLDKNILKAIFTPSLETYSPTHILESLKSEYGDKINKLFPPTCVIHGTKDKTIPHEGCLEFASKLESLNISVTTKFYDGWTHTDPILEGPIDGNHRYHKDIFNQVMTWTKTENKIDHGIFFDDTAPIYDRYCAHFLVMLGRFVNPF